MNNVIPFMKEATEITKEKIEQIIEENEKLGFDADHIGVAVPMELLRDILNVINGLKTENKLILENSKGLEEQRAAFAMKIEEQRFEIERLKAQPTIIETEHFKYVFPQKDGDEECEKTQFNGTEEVFGVHTDTAGNFHWIGTKTGHHKVR